MNNTASIINKDNKEEICALLTELGALRVIYFLPNKPDSNLPDKHFQIVLVRCVS